MSICPRTPRALHSFPTRRSSDLRRAGVGAAEVLVFLALAELDPDPGSEYDWHLRDRKSTRLNSSHVRISYAVFCLKKKDQVNELGVFGHDCDVVAWRGATRVVEC